MQHIIFLVISLSINGYAMGSILRVYHMSMGRGKCSQREGVVPLWTRVVHPLTSADHIHTHELSDRVGTS